MIDRAVLTLTYLYPTLMNIYGDRGNVMCLSQRCAWRGIDLHVLPAGVGERVDFAAADLVLIGGAQDRQQSLVADDLQRVKGDGLREAIEHGLVGLAVCGGYQMLGRYYRPAEGPDLPGLGLFPHYTRHHGTHMPRCIGNVVVEWMPPDRPPVLLVGFENHGGRTYLETPAAALGRVRHGLGNNGQDGTEGARVHNLFGTYLHGSLLPKNPQFADHLLGLALQRKYGVAFARAMMQTPLDDTLENMAHDTAVRLTLGTA